MRLGEPGCVSPRENLTRRCGGAEEVREGLKISLRTSRTLREVSSADFVRDPEGFRLRHRLSTGQSGFDSVWAPQRLRALFCKQNPDVAFCWNCNRYFSSALNVQLNRLRVKSVDGNGCFFGQTGIVQRNGNRSFNRLG